MESTKSPSSILDVEIEGQNIAKKIDSLTTHAVVKHKAGRLEEAIVLYLQVVDFSHQAPDWVYGNLIALKTQAKDYEQAILLGDQALEQYPNSDTLHRSIGMAVENQGNKDESHQHYLKAIEFNHKQPGWLYAKILAYLNSNFLFEKSVEIGSIAEENIDNKKDNCWVYFNLGVAFYNLEQYQETVNHLQKSLSLNSELAWTYYYLAEAFANLEKWDLAFPAYCRALQLEPNISDVVPKLNCALDKRAKSDLARKLDYYHDEIEQDSEKLFAYYKARDLKPLDSQIYTKLAQEFERTGQKAKAICFQHIGQMLR